MAGADAFLDAIFANWQDPMPRLVYADWLEENGHGGYAAFIRDCYRLSQEVPSFSYLEAAWRACFELLQQLFREWQDLNSRSLPVQPDWRAYPQGVLTRAVYATAAEVVTASDRWMPLVHVRDLWITRFEDRDHGSEVAACPALSGVRSLTLPGRPQYQGDSADAERGAIVAALRSPRLVHLAHLTIGPLDCTRSFLEELTALPLFWRPKAVSVRVIAANVSDPAFRSQLEITNTDVNPLPATAMKAALKQ